MHMYIHEEMVYDGGTRTRVFLEKKFMIDVGCRCCDEVLLLFNITSTQTLDQCDRYTGSKDCIRNSECKCSR